MARNCTPSYHATPQANKRKFLNNLFSILELEIDVALIFSNVLGKTHTILGTPEDPGIIPRTVKSLFNLIEKETSAECSFKIQLSFLEIYNERVSLSLLLFFGNSVTNSSLSKLIFCIKLHSKYHIQCFI